MPKGAFKDPAAVEAVIEKFVRRCPARSAKFGEVDGFVSDLAEAVKQRPKWIVLLERGINPSWWRLAAALLERRGHDFRRHALTWSKHKELKNYWTRDAEGRERVVIALRGRHEQPPEKLTVAFLAANGLAKAFTRTFVSSESNYVDALAALAEQTWPGEDVETERPKRYWESRENRIAYVEGVARSVLKRKRRIRGLKYQDAARVAPHLRPQRGKSVWQLLHELDPTLPTKRDRTLDGSRRTPRLTKRELVRRIRNRVAERFGENWARSLDQRRLARAHVLYGESKPGRSGRQVRAPQAFLSSIDDARLFIADQRADSTALLAKALPEIVHPFDLDRRETTAWNALAGTDEGRAFTRWVVRRFYSEKPSSFHGDATTLKADGVLQRLYDIYGNLYTAITDAFGPRVAAKLQRVHAPRGTRSARDAELERVRRLLEQELRGPVTRPALLSWVAAKQRTGGVKKWIDEHRLTTLVRQHFNRKTPDMLMAAAPGLMHPWEFDKGVRWSDPKVGLQMAKEAIEHLWATDGVNPTLEPTRAADVFRVARLQDEGLRSILRVPKLVPGTEQPEMLRLAKFLWPRVSWSRSDFPKVDEIAKLGNRFEAAAIDFLLKLDLSRSFEDQPPTPVGDKARRADLMWLDSVLEEEFGAPFIDFKLRNGTFSDGTAEVARNYPLLIVYCFKSGKDPARRVLPAVGFVSASDFANRVGKGKKRLVAQFLEKCTRFEQRYVELQRQRRAGP